MSKLFNLSSVKTHPQRNGFDLSQRNVFSTSLGILQPVCTMEAIPGDKFKLSINSLVRTQTLNKAAFVRTNEYFDWFFVPTRLLWRYFPQWVMSVDRTESVSSTYSDATPAICPYFKISQIFDLFRANITAQRAGINNDICRLLDLLGYGSYFEYVNDAGGEQPIIQDFDVNPFRLAAYQKIYYDFYRNTCWEKSNARSFNFDYVDAGWYTTQPAGLSSNILNGLTQMHYAYAKKDYFMGLKPNMQYGSVALAPVVGSSIYNSSTGEPYPAGGNTAMALRSFPGGLFGSSPSGGDVLLEMRSSLSILDLRRAEALQRWKEVTEANDQRYNAQVQAHFGVRVPDSRAQLAEFIGGVRNPISISEVVATSAGTADGSSAGSSVLGQIGGKGLGISDGSDTFEYEAKEHGIIMCIHHIMPELDYNSTLMDKYNTKLDKEDYFTPEYDHISLAPVRLYEYQYDPFEDNYSAGSILGYAPRWLDYKTGIDKVHFEFNRNGSMSAWVGQSRQLMSDDLAFNDLLITPSYYNSIFAVAWDGSPATDQFLCNAYFSVGSVRNMSIDSMPY